MDEATVPATRLVERLAARDLDGFVAALAPDARLRYLVPPGPGEVSGADEVGEKLWSWFGGAVSVGVLDVQVEPLPDRVSARYRFLLEQRDGWEVVEQQMYVDADEDGLIAGIDLLCSGFRPTAGPEEGGLLAMHRFDAGTLGCADGLAREFRRRILAIPLGDLLEIDTEDPAAKEDLPPLARMMGHTVRSVEPSGNGRLLITVERGR